MTGSVLNHMLILTIINLSCHRFPSLLLRMLIRIAKCSQLVYVHFIILGNELTDYPLSEALSVSQKFKISLRTPQKTHCVFIVRTHAVNEHYRCLFIESYEIHEYCVLFGKTAKMFTVKVDYLYSNHYAMKSSLCLNSYNSQCVVLRLLAFWDGVSNTARSINPLNAELNPTCHLLALLGAHHILHVSRIRVNISLL